MSECFNHSYDRVDDVPRPDPGENHKRFLSKRYLITIIKIFNHMQICSFKKQCRTIHSAVSEIKYESLTFLSEEKNSILFTLLLLIVIDAYAYLSIVVFRTKPHIHQSKEIHLFHLRLSQVLAVPCSNNQEKLLLNIKRSIIGLYEKVNKKCIKKIHYDISYSFSFNI